MKLYKKSQEVGRSTILMVILLLLLLVAMGIIIWQSWDIMVSYIDKIYG